MAIGNANFFKGLAAGEVTQTIRHWERRFYIIDHHMQDLRMRIEIIMCSRNSMKFIHDVIASSK